MSNNKSFLNGRAPPYSQNLLKEIKRIAPNVFLICRRNKNKNVVVYEAILKEDGSLDEKTPVVGYWLILEPSYQEKRKDIPHDREELNILDRNFSWGFESKKIDDKTAKFKLKNYNKTLFVQIDKKGAKLIGEHNNQKYIINSLYVEGSENIQLLNIADNVKNLYLSTTNISANPPRFEKIYLRKDGFSQNGFQL
jgi:hypothetical protein